MNDDIGQFKADLALNQSRGRLLVYGSKSQEDQYELLKMISEHAREMQEFADRHANNAQEVTDRMNDTMEEMVKQYDE